LANSEQKTPYLCEKFGENEKLPFLKIHIEQLVNNDQYFCPEIVTQPITWDMAKKQPYSSIFETIECFRRLSKTDFDPITNLTSYVETFNDLLCNVLKKNKIEKYYENFKLNLPERLQDINIEFQPTSTIKQTEKKIYSEAFYQLTILVPFNHSDHPLIARSKKNDQDKFRNSNKPYCTYVNQEGQKTDLYALEGRVKNGYILNIINQMNTVSEGKLRTQMTDIYKIFKKVFFPSEKEVLTLPEIPEKKVNNPKNKSSNVVPLPSIIPKKIKTIKILKI
jgi:hypothetical protein